MMADMDSKDMLWTAQSPPRPEPRVGELLFEFVRASDRAPMSCELRFNGESYGWEAQFFERGEFHRSRGGFGTRALAEQWASVERDALAALRT